MSYFGEFSFLIRQKKKKRKYKLIQSENVDQSHTICHVILKRRGLTQLSICHILSVFNIKIIRISLILH
ncbi:hypothetical protein GWI33_022095 [Rhynchophorus ferrugineus]|uniref:Uncharacterized protein n=1 Tax=Rhynchophorus ferrugineus TaxID=354439 RepID=A0A834MJA5_RHYFE|nr:hypothetical protein GWI33_022095 [Rhynchophorus ferrugineus]